MTSGSAASADVAVVGLWHLGAVASAAWTSVGLKVVAWDPEPGLREIVSSGGAPVVEPGVDSALHVALEQRALRVVDTAAEAISAASVTHVAFDTRVGPSGLHDDPRLDDVVAAFTEHAPDSALILVSSQLPVGTCGRWQREMASTRPDLTVCHVPENLRLGSALNDFVRPARLIIGADDDDAYERVRTLFAHFSSEPLRMRLASAEMAKHATNAYLALCVAFANDLAYLAAASDADPVEVVAGLRMDPRVSPQAPLRPGPPFSGATLARDLEALRAVGEAHDRSSLFEAVLDANERHAKAPVAWLEDALGPIRGRRIAVAGLTYKPGTSTLRDSWPLRVASLLVQKGAAVAAWDPLAEPFTPARGIVRSPTLDDAVDGSHALVVLTAHPELSALDWDALSPAERNVVDACMVVDRAAAEASGWSYRGLAVS